MQNLTTNCKGKYPKPNWLRYFFGVSLQILYRSLFRSYLQKPFQPNEIIIKQLEIPLIRLAPTFDGYRIVHLSDLHFGTWLDSDKLSIIIDLVNNQHPDLVAITGDMISYISSDLIKSLVPALQRLSATDGIVAVRGNHDCWAKQEQYHNLFDSSGGKLINNSILSLQRQNQYLHVCGLDTAFYAQDRLDIILAQLPKQSSAILLSHEPDTADNVSASNSFELQLSGHTHGGQIVLPIIGSPWLPRLGRKYPSGLYKVNGMYLYTNRGIGTASLPFRYNCPAEIAVITLRSTSAITKD